MRFPVLLHHVEDSEGGGDEFVEKDQKDDFHRGLDVHGIEINLESVFLFQGKALLVDGKQVPALRKLVLVQGNLHTELGVELLREVHRVEVEDQNGLLLVEQNKIFAERTLSLLQNYRLNHQSREEVGGVQELHSAVNTGEELPPLVQVWVRVVKVPVVFGLADVADEDFLLIVAMTKFHYFPNSSIIGCSEGPVRLLLKLYSEINYA